MPAMHFDVRWPDGTVSLCYSPSRIVTEYFEIGRCYAITDFVDRSRTALNFASERVQQKYGYACTAAMAQLQEIESYSRRFEGGEDAFVVVESIHP